jgi:hypothetical protein
LAASIDAGPASFVAASLGMFIDAGSFAVAESRT